MRWSQVNVAALPPQERADIDEQLQAAARKHRVPQTEHLAADALYHISVSEPRAFPACVSIGPRYPTCTGAGCAPFLSLSLSSSMLGRVPRAPRPESIHAPPPIRLQEVSLELRFSAKSSKKFGIS